MPRKITIHQIAKEVGLNASTVSLALRGDPKVREKTRDRILEAAKRMNYEPNNLARSLSNGRTRIIGVMLSDMSRFYEESLEAVFTLGEAAGFTISVRFCSWDQAREKAGLHSFVSNRIDGIIWGPTDYNTAEIAEMDALLHKFEVPTVMYGLPDDTQSLHCYQIGLDMQKSIQVGLAHLKSYGHTDIALLAATEVQGMFGRMYRRRMAMFRDAFIAEGLHLDDRRIFEVGDDNCGGLDLALKLSQMERSQWPTAIFAADDLLARELVKSFKTLGVRVPEEISVIGYDVFPWAMGGQLCSVNLNTKEIGEKAIQMLLKCINSEHPQQFDQRVEVLPQIRLGTTCGRPRSR
ncbi:LacI family DNA-binding transcriptional regulator [Coraliomargarita sp. SDUM461004]|uniref:LacI family DNA-binding transcriptional regulator n=1 Tax=Thalassobacterium sedimentorum TaxID=3041258 RepID=A0ABU1AFC0_9BACT|nr:LacI family DNA-binding transcriptional regulator [Coraliomargarita sp. SDUM461004]MDQ8193509.1 LacI family DNA-binding transcriptional regulator [Coraliomargarita sp. SDUM461004]